MVEELMTESSQSDLGQIGYRIRSEREKKGWSIADVSASLRINEKILKAIEEGRSEEGIAPVFMRGFIRSYLRHLKLWDDTIDTPLQNVPELKQKAIKPVFQKTYVPKESHLLRNVTFLLLLLCSGYLVYAYYFSPEIIQEPTPVAEEKIKDDFKPEPKPKQALTIGDEASGEASQGEVVLESIAAKNGDPEIDGTSTDHLDSSQTPYPEESLVESIDSPESAISPAKLELQEVSTEGETMQSFVTGPQDNKPLPLPPLELLISATERTWMSISLDGDVYQDVQFHAGESYVWEAKESFRLTLGNTAVMHMMLDGREIEFDRSKSLLQDWVIDSNPVE
jgi:cytoskeleton protein RodZ